MTFGKRMGKKIKLHSKLLNYSNLNDIDLSTK